MQRQMDHVLRRCYRYLQSVYSWMVGAGSPSWEAGNRQDVLEWERLLDWTRVWSEKPESCCAPQIWILGQNSDDVVLDKGVLLGCFVCQNISLYEPEQSLSLSQDEGEGAEVYPKQSSLERSF